MKSYFLSAAFIILFRITCYSQTNQRIQYNLPEYHCTFNSFHCEDSLIKSIHAFRFLKIRFIDGCKEMEVACFNSKDSSLIEAGKYKNISQIVSTKALKRNISTDKQETVTLQINHLQRVGEWKFYDTFGKNIRKEQYPIQ